VVDTILLLYHHITEEKKVEYHILREEKSHYIFREKSVLSVMNYCKLKEARK